MDYKSPNSPIHRKIFTFVLLTLLNNTGVLAGTDIYKYVDKNGVVSFSTIAPTSVNNIEKINVRSSNVSETTRVAKKKKQVEKRKQLVKKHDKISSRIKKRIEKKKSHAEEISLAKKEIERRRDALVKGKVPLPGERVGTVYRRTRLLQSYHDRVITLENGLASAEEKLRELKQKR